MPNETSQWIDAIVRLTTLTQDGSLVWTVQPVSSDPNLVGPTYLANHKDRKLRIRKRREKEVAGLWGPPISRERYLLDFVDEFENSLWEFPEAAVLEDLYAAVQFQTAGVKGFLEDLLS